MKKYETLEHKADLKIRAFGKTKEELFLNMMLAMVESLKPEIEKDTKAVKRTIKIKSLDSPTLLVDFLSEVLYQIQVNKEAYYDLKINNLSETEIEGEIIGKKAERFGEDIKAVTYHNLELKQNENWQATVLFDI